MKKVALMQPYLFPYIGYFQMIHAVDEFVIYDDIQYRKGGWINRNRILVDGKASYITLPVKRDSTYLDINERVFAEPFKDNKDRILRQMTEAYVRAPFFQETLALVERIFAAADDRNVAASVEIALRAVSDHLALRTSFLRSSNVCVPAGARGQRRVIYLVRARAAQMYVNLPGGRSLYEAERFQSSGILLRFIDSEPTTYAQDSAKFVPNLSILDLLMCVGADEARRLVTRYRLAP